METASDVRIQERVYIASLSVKQGNTGQSGNQIGRRVAYKRDSNASEVRSTLVQRYFSGHGTS